MRPAPAHEFADDYTAYLAECQAHARRWHYAENLIAALILAAHAQQAEQRLPTRESHSAHQAHVQHFAAIVRAIHANARALGQVPRISNYLARGMVSRGVLVSEVETEVSV